MIKSNAERFEKADESDAAVVASPDKNGWFEEEVTAEHTRVLQNSKFKIDKKRTGHGKKKE